MAPIRPTTPVITFARAPQTLTYTLIDYNAKSGIKTYKTGSTPLTTEGFNLDSDNIFMLLAALKTRAQIMNWKSSLMTIKFDGTQRNLLDHYAVITETKCIEHVKTYLFASNCMDQDD